MIKTLTRCGLLAAALLAVASAGGCSVIAWTATQFAPPQKVKALYHPPQGKTVLVFVDDVRDPVSYELIKRDLTEEVNKQLIEHKLAAQAVSYERLLEVVGQNKNFNQLRVVDVGKAVGADLVLYVEITKFRLKEAPGTALWDGQLVTSVRWVSTTASTPDEARLWPKDHPGASGYDLPAVGMPTKEDPSLSYGSELSKNLATRMADQIGKLFYDYEVSQQIGEEPAPERP